MSPSPFVGPSPLTLEKPLEARLLWLILYNTERRLAAALWKTCVCPICLSTRGMKGRQAFMAPTIGSRLDNRANRAACLV